ncbi:F0F1 ATP synthase subunit alpha [Patescibacteria group bacterium]|nr:F0F1 ATP synthase subunit alpha [Patescibacteria group bacterium]
MSSKKFYVDKFKRFRDEIGEVGCVEVVTPPLAYISGLPGARLGEVIYFDCGQMGQVMSLNQDQVEVLLFTDDPLLIGSEASRCGEVLKISVSQSLLGMAINPLGDPIYTNTPIFKAEDRLPLERETLGIAYREKITESFLTGVSVVDLLIPLGKGQRELVIGDRKTGKTIFLLQTMLTQATRDTICIYAGIGKKKADIRKVEAFIKDKGFVDRTVIIATGASDPLGLIYISPYAAMSLAEYFRDVGYDVLLILDDLTTHAKAYREISLLGKRFPGRSSYPGDVFYLHSRLLERGGCFKTEHGIKSITCLPVAETIEGDISGYVQTNLMSITDGHLYFDTDLFKEGRRPALNNFLSVTRVGRQTQTKLRWTINREISSFLVLYNKTLSFVHFGAELNEGIKSTLNMGERLLTFFDQSMGKIYDMKVQLIVFSLIWTGIINIESNDDVNIIAEMCNSYYSTNSSFKALVDSVLVDEDDINALLGKMGQNAAKFNEYFKDRPRIGDKGE